ncbi:unnamed protein product [Ectocarpus sp. 12 AP-2014]
MNYNQFQPGGVSPNPQGTAYPAVQTNFPANLFAQMQMLKAFSGSSDSYSSSSSKVSIVKYDDHFKKKGADFCHDRLQLEKPNPNTQPGAPSHIRLTKEELKENPPLALKFGDKDCQIVLPIPSYKAMCKAAEKMISDYLSHSNLGTSTDTKKQAADAISQMLLQNFVRDCGYGDEALDQACYDKGVVNIPNESQAQQKQRLSNAALPANRPAVESGYDTAAPGAMVGDASAQEAKVQPYRDQTAAWM